MCFSEGQRATNKGVRKPSIYHGVCCFSRGKRFSFHQQCLYPVTKRHKPMLFPTALLLLIYEIFAWRFAQTQNFLVPRPLRSNTIVPMITEY